EDSPLKIQCVGVLWIKPPGFFELLASFLVAVVLPQRVAKVMMDDGLAGDQFLRLLKHGYRLREFIGGEEICRLVKKLLRPILQVIGRWANRLRSRALRLRMGRGFSLWGLALGHGG